MVVSHIASTVPLWPDNTASLRNSTRPPDSQPCWAAVRLWFVLLLIAAFPLAAYGNDQQPHYTVAIEGVEAKLLDNVRAHLSLIRHQTDSSFSTQRLDEDIQRAREEIGTALQPFGYYAPAIEITSSGPPAAPLVRVSIAPGSPVQITQVVLACEGRRCADQAVQERLQAFALQQGMVFDHQQYEAAKKNLLNSILNLGYQRVAFSKSLVEVSPPRLSATIRLTVDIDIRYTFGQLTFECDFINHDLLRRVVAYREGDPLSPTTLTNMRQSLLGTGYFETAELHYDLNTADAQGRVPVTVALTPGKRNRYGIGIGYGTDTGARGTLEWYNRRLNRLGHQLDMAWRPSERKSYFGGTYTIPISDPRTERLSILGRWENEEFDETETTGWSSQVSYDHLKQNGEYSVYLRLLDEDYTIGSNGDHATILSPGAKITWRWADSRVFTAKGMSLSAEVKGGNSNLLSDTTFVQGTLGGKGILAFNSSWRLIGRGNIGATAADDFYELPPTYRFYAGGDQSVRGYGYKRIGPKDDQGNIIGGQYLLTYSVELEKRLFKDWGCALFFDSGTATNSWENLRMRNGAGVGLRWFAPFGQVRLDVAKALDTANSWRLHFTMGADF